MNLHESRRISMRFPFRAAAPEGFWAGVGRPAYTIPNSLRPDRARLLVSIIAFVEDMRLVRH